MEKKQNPKKNWKKELTKQNANWKQNYQQLLFNNKLQIQTIKTQQTKNNQIKLN